MTSCDLLFIGFGAVHRALSHILIYKKELLARRYGLTFGVVGVADSGGARFRAEGFDLAGLLAHKGAGASVHTFPGGQPVPTAVALAQIATYDFLCEATPVNLSDGEPGLSCVRAALRRGKGVVLANKAPLVLDYRGLHGLAHRQAAGLAFSATVCGGLPVINVGRRDLAAAEIYRIEGILNSTSNYILSRMAAGEDYAAALAEAQRRGIAETDPSLDVGGWDAANKLVILANTLLDYPARLADVAVQGIADLGPAEMAAAQRRGQVIKLLARAEQTDAGYRLSVGPQPVPVGSFWAGIGDWQMGVAFHTDIYEEIYLKIDEREPTATAAAMLRDLIHLAGHEAAAA